MQIAALLFTLLAPLMLWGAAGKWRGPKVRLGIRRTLASTLLLLAAADFVTKFALGESSLERGLPMQLCDWAMLATILALWRRGQNSFELAYFWGLSGTAQALLTPALASTAPWWRQFAFFFIHALIVVGVLHLLLTERLRPGRHALARGIGGTMCYFFCAIFVNALTGGNYGFLSHRPAQASLLDLFSDELWLYRLQIILTGTALFTVLDLPWLLRAGWSGRERTSSSAQA